MANRLNVQNIYASDSDTTAAVQVSGANITLNGTANDLGTVTSGTFNGTIGTSATFPTRSDFGIIEIFEAGNPLIDYNQSQDFSYTAGEPYFVMCNIRGGADNDSLWEYYNITTSNTVTELKPWTVLISPSIPSNGTLRISVGNNVDRDVWAVLLVRMNH